MLSFRAQAQRRPRHSLVQSIRSAGTNYYSRLNMSHGTLGGATTHPTIGPPRALYIDRIQGKYIISHSQAALTKVYLHPERGAHIGTVNNLRRERTPGASTQKSSLPGASSPST